MRSLSITMKKFGIAPRMICQFSRGARSNWANTEPSRLARSSGKRLEKHYGHAQDIEWAVAQSGEILFLQARPETVWSARDGAKAPAAGPPGDPFAHVMATLTNRGKTP